MTAIQPKPKSTPHHTVLTLYREIEEHRLLYTLRSRPAARSLEGNASTLPPMEGALPPMEGNVSLSYAYTLTVEHLCGTHIRESTLEDFSTDLEEATAFTRMMAAELVFPEHLYDIWKDTLGEDSLLCAE